MAETTGSIISSPSFRLDLCLLLSQLCLHAAQIQLQITPVVSCDLQLSDFLDDLLEIAEAGDRAANLTIQQRGAFAAASEQNRSLDIVQRYVLSAELESEPSVSRGKGDPHAGMSAEPLTDPFHVFRFVLVLDTGRILFVRPKGIADLDLTKAPVWVPVPPSTDALALHFFEVPFEQGWALA